MRGMVTVVDVPDPDASTVTATPATSADVSDGGPPPRRRRSDRERTYFAAFFLVFLTPVIVFSWSHGPLRRWGSVTLVAVFAAWYVAGLLAGEQRPPRWVRGLPMPVWFAGMVLLTLAATSLLGPSGLMFLFFVAAAGGGAITGPGGLAVVLAAGLTHTGAGLALGMEWPWALGVGGWIAFVGLSVWLGERSSRAQQDAVDAREQRAELAVDLERARMARDLHDILGHSLTVVAVKAQLAGRLVDADPERAKAEIADVERLARDALADVRATVRSFRDLSLPAELAGARRAFEAAEVEADVPGAAEHVRSDLRELFAWVVREGVTNVVRHSGARHASVVLGADSVEIRDDGRGFDDAHRTGSGLLGLDERARQAEATMTIDSTPGRGTVLRVSATPGAGTCAATSRREGRTP